VPLRGIWAAQLRASTARRLTRLVCGRAAVVEIVVPATQVDRGSLRKGGGILDGNRHFVASTEPVPRRMTLVTSEPELSVQEAGPGRVSRFCSQVLPQMT